jgi:hypothetical protein
VNTQPRCYLAVPLPEVTAASYPVAQHVNPAQQALYTTFSASCRELGETDALSGGRRDLQAKGYLMTAAPCSQPAGEDPDDTGRMHELRLELDLWGIVIEDPAEGMPVSVLHLPGARCEIGLRGPCALTLTYLPMGRDLYSYEAVWLALSLLDRPPVVPTAAVVPDPGLPLEDSVGRVLAACGMAVEPGQIGYGDGEVTAALLVANPADQSRGRLTISGGRELTWECRFDGPGSPAPGLSPSGTARAIAAALAVVAGEAR